jgi:hypothetical protein
MLSSGEKPTPTTKLDRNGYSSRYCCGTYRLRLDAICFIAILANPPVNADPGDWNVAARCVDMGRRQVRSWMIPAQAISLAGIQSDPQLCAQAPQATLDEKP